MRRLICFLSLFISLSFFNLYAMENTTEIATINVDSALIIGIIISLIISIITLLLVIIGILKGKNNGLTADVIRELYKQYRYEFEYAQKVIFYNENKKESNNGKMQGVKIE